MMRVTLKDLRGLAPQIARNITGDAYMLAQLEQARRRVVARNASVYGWTRGLLIHSLDDGQLYVTTDPNECARLGGY